MVAILKGSNIRAQGRRPCVSVDSIPTLQGSNKQSKLGLQATTIPIGAEGDSDADGDGFTDLQELLANTNASDAGYYLVVWSTDAEGIEVRFPAQPGRRYRIERCTSLKEGTWELLAETDLLTVAQEIGIPVDDQGDARCFRVWALAP